MTADTLHSRNCIRQVDALCAHAYNSDIVPSVPPISELGQEFLSRDRDASVSTRRFGISIRFASLFSEVPLFAAAAQNFAG